MEYHLTSPLPWGGYQLISTQSPSYLSQSQVLRSSLSLLTHQTQNVCVATEIEVKED